MLRIFLALASLLASSEAYAQEYHAVGSRCTPTTERDNEPVEHASCSTIYMPAGTFPAASFHEELPWKNRLKADRTVPLRPVTAEAAR